MGEPKLIKVCLTNKGEDTETPWAHDLGPAPGPSGSRKVKLVNVPFMHAKPTWGDTIVVSPVTEGFPTWDRGGIPWKQISSRIVEDGGRWAMILDYVPHSGASNDDAFGALARACQGDGLVCEGAWAPRDSEPGRVYLAVPKDVTAEAVMEHLSKAGLPVVLIQVHPEPKKLPRAQTAVGVVPHTPRVPAKRARTVDEQLEQVVAAKPGRARTEPPVEVTPAQIVSEKPARKAAPAAAKKAAPAPAKAGAKKAAPAPAKAVAKKGAAAPAKAAAKKATPAAKKAAPAKAAAKKASAAPAKKPAAKKPAKKK